MPRLPLFALVLVATLARAAPSEDQWFTVLLDGRKIGSFESTREERGGRVTTTQTLDLSIERAGITVALTSKETSEETAEGKPIAFKSLSKLSGTETTIEGRVDGGKIAVTTTTGGAVQQREIAWPEGALLPEGLRLVALRAGLEPGTRYRALAFQPSSLDATEVSALVRASEPVDLPGGKKTLSEIEQTIAFGTTPVKSRQWVDAEQNVYKLTMPVIGVDLVMLACDRACATAPNQGTDIFDRTLMASPRALTHDELARGMRYVLAPKDGGAALNLPDTGEQRVAKIGKALSVEIAPEPRARDEAKPAAADYAPNDWLQSKAPEIEALAKRAVGDATDPEERMRRAETFVRGFITNKSLGVGYASALEVAQKPEGDCTEHAVLLAALGRSLGIATRVVDGLAYAPGFAGKDRVFVPHAWVQAWIGNRWQSFDAALPGFDAGHIALSVGDGDPWRFYAGLDTLGRIELKKAEPLATEIIR
ncbi:MAG TPA: transglutaminase-like domain-containing protein [Rhodanobacteraceae bacterium]|nr:transglutaminase-like domain-containing protein [Rhodanobacteraceae bacterium]